MERCETPNLPFPAPVSPGVEMPAVPVARRALLPRAVPARPVARPRAPKRRGSPLRTLLAVLGLAALTAGALMLVPRGRDPEAPRVASQENSQPTIVVDAGHGGHDNGASRNGLHEKDLTLDTALRLEKLLKKKGFSVVLTRSDDSFVDLPGRVEIANGISHALFVSIHFNDNTGAAGQGVETFYPSDKELGPQPGWSFANLFKDKPEPPPADNGLAFAQAVQSAITGAMPVTDRGVKPARYAVIRRTRCPAVLIEGGFISNPAQAREIAKPTYRDKLAASIAEGIAGYQRQRATEANGAKIAQAK